MKTVELFGFDFISSDSLDSILDDLFKKDEIVSADLPLLITPNVDQIVKLHRQEYAWLNRKLTHARYILPDGQPLVTLSKLKKGKHGLKKRLTGADLFVKFWERLNKTNHKILLVVPAEEVGDQLIKEYDHAQYYCPPFFELKDVKTLDNITTDLKTIVDSFCPKFMIIGLGFPKQERIFLELIGRREKNNFPLTMLLGASFEFYLGVKKRAPKAMQKLGLEFLHRFLSEPRRMFKRYFIDDLKFIPLAFRELRKK